MEENRFPLTGTVIEIGETRQTSAYFRKREFKLRFTDIDFNGKVVERFPKFSLINDNCELFDAIKVDMLIQIRFYLDGRDYVKEGKSMNFTSAVCYDVVVVNDPQGSDEDKKAVITENGLIAST
jgi:hypothetical protein